MDLIIISFVCDAPPANQLDYFVVGLTNRTPSTSPPPLYGYTTCGWWSTAAPPGGSLFVPCYDYSPPARYVVIIGHNPLGLSVCELEVYTRGTVYCAACFAFRTYFAAQVNRFEIWILLSMNVTLILDLVYDKITVIIVPT